jgi:hypothetical protein
MLARYTNMCLSHTVLTDVDIDQHGTDFVCREVSFDASHGCQPQPISKAELVDAKGFCKLISPQQQSKLCMLVRSHQLVDPKYSSRDIGHWILDVPSVPLDKILSKGCLTHRMRLFLSVILATAVWQFYESDWMNQDWAKGHIHFMFTRRAGYSNGGLYASEPFLSTHFSDAKDQIPLKGRSHKYPKILSLGIMLLEIELDLTIESRRCPEHLCPDGKPNLSTDYLTACILFSDPRFNHLWDSRETFKKHRAVIGDCVTREKFEACTNSAQEREALYKHVVLPLKALLKATWEDPDISSLGQMNLSTFVPIPKAVDPRSVNQHCGKQNLVGL